MFQGQAPYLLNDLQDRQAHAHDPDSYTWLCSNIK